MTFWVPFAKMHYNCAQINAHQKQLGSPYKRNLSNTFPTWKYSVYNLSNMIWLINFKLNKLKLPKDPLKFSWLDTWKGWLLMACEWNPHLKKSHSRHIPQNTWVALLRTVQVIKNKVSLRNCHSQDESKATEENVPLIPSQLRGVWGDAGTCASQRRKGRAKRSFHHQIILCWIQTQVCPDAQTLNHLALLSLISEKE